MINKSTSLHNTSKERVGLLLVHGIGEQEPGVFLSQFRDGFSRLFGHERVQEKYRFDPMEEGRRVHTATIELETRKIFIYEVHWANLIAPNLARGSFDPAQVFVLAWFPWFNKLTNLPGFDSYSKAEIIWWTLRIVPLSVLFFLGYIGLKAIPHLFQAWDSVEEMIGRSDQAYKVRQSSAVVGKKSVNRLLRKKSRRKKAITPRIDLRKLEHRGWFDRFMDKYAGDVVNCVISMAHLPKLRGDITIAQSALQELLNQEKEPNTIAELEKRLIAETNRQKELKELANNIFSRFDRVVRIAVKDDQCRELHVLGHSLGTFIAYQAMNRSNMIISDYTDSKSDSSDTLSAKLTHFYTIGSPLEKIRFFWPGLVVPRTRSPVIQIEDEDTRVFIQADSTFQWYNYYSHNDQVSGKLQNYGAWSDVTNNKIIGLGGVFTAHVGYGKNQIFLNELAKNLGAVLEEKHISFWSRLAAWACSFLQGMLFPLFIIGVCMLGILVLVGFSAISAVLLVGIGKGIVFLLHHIQVRWASDWNWWTIFYWTTAFFGFSMLCLVSIFVPMWGKLVARIAVKRDWARGVHTEKVS